MNAYESLPKVDLHRHLEGSLRLSTLVEVAKTLGQNTQGQQFQVLNPLRNLGEVLDRFSALQRTLATPEIITRMTFEVCEDAFHDGVKILELRYAPTFIAEGHTHLDFEKIHMAILRGVKMAEKFPMAVGLIGILQRPQPLAASARVVDFMVEHASSFVGIDIADQEDQFKASKFVNLIDKARKAGLHVTIHAGEVADGTSHFNVREAIDMLGAERIGHGLQIALHEETLDYVKTRQIPLELCLTSNWITQAVPTLADHPLKKFFDAGVKVTLNTDDPGVFGVNFSNECRIACDVLGFSTSELNTMMRTAAHASFIDESLKKKYFSNY